MVDKGLRINCSSRPNLNYGKTWLYLKTQTQNYLKEKGNNTAAKEFSVDFALRIVLLADKF